MKAFRNDMLKRRRALILAIRITVVLLAVLFLLASVMLILDIADASSPSESDRDGSKDRTAPTITLKDSEVIFLEVGQKPTWRSYVTAKDSGGTVELDVDASRVRTDKVGVYYVTYTATDSAGNVVLSLLVIAISYMSFLKVVM